MDNCRIPWMPEVFSLASGEKRPSERVVLVGERPRGFFLAASRLVFAASPLNSVAPNEKKNLWHQGSCRSSWLQFDSVIHLSNNPNLGPGAWGLGPGARFSKAQETLQSRKAIAKSRTLRFQRCFITNFLI